MATGLLEFVVSIPIRSSFSCTTGKQITPDCCHAPSYQRGMSTAEQRNRRATYRPVGVGLPRRRVGRDAEEHSPDIGARMSLSSGKGRIHIQRHSQPPLVFSTGILQLHAVAPSSSGSNNLSDSTRDRSLNHNVHKRLYQKIGS